MELSLKQNLMTYTLSVLRIWSLRNLLSKLTIQEPTFDRIIVVYRGLFQVAVVGSVEMPKADLWVIFAILSTVIGYCSKIYFTFQQNMATYQNLITQSMYRRGTLLHLCDDVIQQEVKEVIISFFILMENGKATLEDLDQQCEELIRDECGERCNFDVDDAVHKLEKLGIVCRVRFN